MPALDLDDIQSRTLDEAVLPLRHPLTGEVTSTRLTLAAPDSATFRRRIYALQDKALHEAARKPHGAVISAEEQLRLNILTLVAATLNWEHMVCGGAELPCTPENAARVYEDYPWLREQVAAFQGERQNFFRA